ncbi:tetratricopeptide repeat protein [Hasllibacter sp. MH4015]|uniref:tetratricopeptide repeat protein n=1 Tax=Hasllibacter sp. MH4015 TaxID=2854029 RepID=UPI001CD231BE|nr:tetratricopeptide repeat protein [Hasllibacter sp. MH4015]
MFRAPLLAGIAALSFLGAPALAQDAALAAQRAAVFQQMLSDPANRTLMRDYARLSVQMRDFEAAAATLERLVDLEPTNSAARVELAIAYFALGSYEVAEYHLAAAQAAGALTPEQTAQVARYREETQDRADGSEFSGRVEAGYAWTDTASDAGAFLNATLDWRIDLGDANATQWVTEFGYSSFQPGDSSINDRQNLRLRTGPEFRIAADAYGPRVQPYVELAWFRDDETLNGDFRSWSVGANYINPINERVTIYADFDIGRIYALDTSGDEFDFHEFDLGVTYRPSRDLRFRLSTTLFERTQADDPTPDTFEGASVRLSGQYAFDPSFQLLPNRWVAGGFIEAGQVDQVVAGTATRLEQQRYAAFLRAFVYEDIYVESTVAQVMEDSISGGVTTPSEEMIFTLQIGWEF